MKMTLLHHSNFLHDIVFMSPIRACRKKENLVSVQSENQETRQHFKKVYKIILQVEIVALSQMMLIKLFVYQVLRAYGALFDRHKQTFKLHNPHMS